MLSYWAQDSAANHWGQGSPLLCWDEHSILRHTAPQVGAMKVP